MQTAIRKFTRTPGSPPLRLGDSLAFAVVAVLLAAIIFSIQAIYSWTLLIIILQYTSVRKFVYVVHRRYGHTDVRVQIWARLVAAAAVLMLVGRVLWFEPDLLAILCILNLGFVAVARVLRYPGEFLTSAMVGLGVFGLAWILAWNHVFLYRAVLLQPIAVSLPLLWWSFRAARPPWWAGLAVSFAPLLLLAHGLPNSLIASLAIASLVAMTSLNLVIRRGYLRPYLNDCPVAMRPLAAVLLLMCAYYLVGYYFEPPMTLR